MRFILSEVRRGGKRGWGRERVKCSPALCGRLKKHHMFLEYYATTINWCAREDVTFLRFCFFCDKVILMKIGLCKLTLFIQVP